MNISITGNLGSGKSSICKILKSQGFEIISAGGIFRQLAVESGMSVEAFNQKVNEDIKKGDRSVDEMIDLRTTNINSERDNVIFDSRLAWNFATGSFKVFVAVDIDEAARRVFSDALRSDSESYSSFEECRAALIHRQDMEKVRFKELYQIDYYDMSNYNLVIESTSASPEAVAGEIMKRFEEYKQDAFTRLVRLNPSSVFATVPVGLIADRCNTEECIRVRLAGDTWFAVGGCSALLSALKLEDDFVTVRVAGGELPVVLSPDECKEWECAGTFQYKKYPAPEISDHPSLLSFSKEENYI